MTIEAIVLALDGVLFDLEEAHLYACNAAFEACGLGLRWAAPQLRNAVLKHGAARAITAAIDGIVPPPKPAELRHLLQQKDEALRRHLLAHPPAPNAACMKLIRHALQSGCKLALVTDLPSPTTSALIEMAFGEEGSGIFSTVVSGANFGGRDGNGPHALVLRTIGIDARDCLAVEATGRGLASAQEAGMKTMSADAMAWDRIDMLPGGESGRTPYGRGQLRPQHAAASATV